MKPCLPCEIMHTDSKGREVERGDPRATGAAYRTKPKYRGGCSEDSPGLGGTEPTPVWCLLLGLGRPQEPRKPVPSTSGGVKRKTRQRGRNGR
jgi:hypothetical protein